jgi:hypothetical protein
VRDDPGQRSGGEGGEGEGGVGGGKWRGGGAGRVGVGAGRVEGGGAAVPVLSWFRSQTVIMAPIIAIKPSIL